MSIEIFDCSKREREICVKTIISSQNTAFGRSPAFKERLNYPYHSFQFTGKKTTTKHMEQPWVLKW